VLAGQRGKRRRRLRELVAVLDGDPQRPVGEQRAEALQVLPGRRGHHAAAAGTVAGGAGRRGDARVGLERGVVWNPAVEAAAVSLSPPGIKAGLKVEILYLDTTGKLRTRASGVYAARTSDRAPTGTLKIPMTFDPTTAGGAAPVAFRFTPQGLGSSRQIDNLYVDPMARR
jgi:hypothetical protein